jgi:SAM-dependent methyltransferase
MSNEEQAKYWNSAAGEVWVQEQARLDVELDPLGRAARAALDPRPGEQILDVGCGAGQTTLQLASAVGPTGRVVGVDISAPLLAAAARRDLPAHVSFVRADAQTHAFEDRFDGVYSRFGILFFDDPVAAFANLRAALKPQGRLAFVCWRSFEENPLMAAPMAAAAKHLPPLPPPDPNAPGPFAFANRSRVTGILEAAGFGTVAVTPHDELIGGNDRAATLEIALKMGPLGRILREQPEHRANVADAVGAAMEPFIVDGIARIPSATWIVTART